MKLTGDEIQARLKDGSIVITPFDPARLNPNSYNLSLDRILVVYDRLPAVRRSPYSETMTEDVTKAIVNWDDDRRRYIRSPVVSDANTFNLDIELAHWANVMDMREDNPTRQIVIPDDGLVLVPGRLYLAHTVEYTETRGLVPCIDGRSSVGRLGLSIHATAGFGDVGFCGTWTLEISVIEPLRIYPFVQLCQISYEPVLGTIQEYKSEKYQGQRAPRASRLWKELQPKEDGHAPQS